MVSQDTTYKLHRLPEGPSREVTLTRDDLFGYYYDMNVVREMEETARDLYQKRYIRGFLHLYVGQVRSVIYNTCEFPLTNNQ